VDSMKNWKLVRHGSGSSGASASALRRVESAGLYREVGGFCTDIACNSLLIPCSLFASD
jgi:hypothetical protein